MVERITQRASLIGRVIEDLTYEGVSPQRFAAELAGLEARPEYKEGGFFVFSNLRPGDYTVRLSGAGFQPKECSAVMLSEPLVLSQPGENELVVAVNAVNGAKITFDEVNLGQAIREGAAVLTQAGTTKLLQKLEAGKVAEAKLASVAGLAEGAIVRIVRGNAIRLRFGPYYLFPSALTRIVGRVASALENPLAGAQVSITQVDGVAVNLTEVQGGKVATVARGLKKAVLGFESDLTTRANDRGDYNLYLGGLAALSSLTLKAKLDGYQAQTKTENIQTGQRKKVDFQLAST